MNTGFSRPCAHMWLAESYSVCAKGSGNLRLALLLSCVWWDSLWEVLASMWSTHLVLARQLPAQVVNPTHHGGRHSTCAEERSGLLLTRTKKPLAGWNYCRLSLLPGQVIEKEWKEVKERTQEIKLCPRYVLPAAYLESHRSFSCLAIIA